MDKSAMVEFLVEKDERSYKFYAPFGAPMGETHDALYEIIQEVIKMAQERAEQIKKEKDSSEKVDDK